MSLSHSVGPLDRWTVGPTKKHGIAIAIHLPPSDGCLLPRIGVGANHTYSTLTYTYL